MKFEKMLELKVTGDPLPNRQWPRPGKFDQEVIDELEEDPMVK